MNELKAFDIVVAEEGYGEGIVKYRRAVYDKSEADKVIADLEESHKMEVEQLLMEIVELKEKLVEQTTLRVWAELQLRHNKYKRCVAMANWCGDACDKWMMRKSKAISLGKDGVEWYHRARRKLFHYMRWQKRWLKLAEKFKEAK